MFISLEAGNQEVFDHQDRFLKEEIHYATRIGMLDLLCIIPPDDVKTFGIPYVQSIIEQGLGKKDIKSGVCSGYNSNRRG